MSAPRIGIWFIGARGGVAATATLGLLALQKQLAGTVGLVSELPQFAGLDLADWDVFVVGGHEIREGTLVESLERLQPIAACWMPRSSTRAGDELDAIDARIRPARLPTAAPTISRPGRRRRCAISRRSRPRDTIAGCKPICASFSSKPASSVWSSSISLHRAGRPTARSCPRRWDELSQAARTIATVQRCRPARCTPSRRSTWACRTSISRPRSAHRRRPSSELAELRGTCHAGQDGKTGETLLKSVLAPMFAARNLEVLSWVGHNIFGNLDGLVLDDPANKAAKIKSKDQLVGNILGYDPQTLVSIEYIRSLGDWKTAWDHIHFRGFLGTPMTLQFTWQGCDSLLAAPLVLDLVRFVELSHRRGEVGVLSHLGQLLQTAARASQNTIFPGNFRYFATGPSGMRSRSRAAA